jgi:pseudaminic acid synthase
MSALLNHRRVFTVAEISANHGQDFNQAVRLVKEAKKAGADAVKFQTFTADTMTLDVNNKHFRVKHPKWGGQTLYQLYQKGTMPWSWFKKLKKVAKEEGIVFFSAAFDKTAVDLLEDIGTPIHKVASFELVDLPLIEYMAKTGKPLIMSTGMASLAEIEQAVTTARRAGAKNITLLKCVSSYPADPKDMNLRTIPDLIKRFRCHAGLSDHSMGIAVSVGAVCLGATVIEKHFTLSRKIRTTDSFFSLEPREFKEMVDNVRVTEQAMGKIHYGPTKDEANSRIYRRSLFVVENMKKGDVFTETNVRSLRPASGLEPKYYAKILGQKSVRAVKKGTPLSLDLIQ